MHYPLLPAQPLATKGVLVVAAAGNEQVNLDHYTLMGFFYGPCNIPLPNILCVAATGPSDQFMSAFSNYGSLTVGVAAPGSNILSTWLSECWLEAAVPAPGLVTCPLVYSKQVKTLHFQHLAQ